MVNLVVVCFVYDGLPNSSRPQAIKFFGPTRRSNLLTRINTDDWCYGDPEKLRLGIPEMIVLVRTIVTVLSPR